MLVCLFSYLYVFVLCVYACVYVCTLCCVCVCVFVPANVQASGKSGHSEGLHGIAAVILMAGSRLELSAYFFAVHAAFRL